MTDKCDICGSTTVDHNELNCSMNRQIFNRKTSEQSIRADERQKVLAEVLEWSKARQYSDEYGVDVAIRFSELRAKLAEMKEGNGR